MTYEEQTQALLDSYLEARAARDQEQLKTDAARDKLEAWFGDAEFLDLPDGTSLRHREDWIEPHAVEGYYRTSFVVEE